MRKRINLRESQLYALVEQALNEISIETKMSAAKKAAEEGDDYMEQFYDKSNPRLKRKFAKDMMKKRRRQENMFRKGVASDAMKAPYVERAAYSPYCAHTLHNRGVLSVTEPVAYGPTNRRGIPMGSGNGRWEDYLMGNSYYENGKWKRPGNLGYDIAKSEPWSEIRRRSNESIAHRVTESVIRMLKEGADDAGWTCEELDTLGSSFYIIDNAWTDYSAEELTKILEQIIIWHIERSEQDDVDNYAEGCNDEGAFLFIKAQDENPDDGSEYKGYPLYIHACYERACSPESDNGWKWWSSETTNMTPEENEVRVEFADGENDPRTALVSQAVANIDWNRIMKSVEIYEGHEEEDDDDPDDDFDYWEEKRYSRMGY